MSKILRVSEWTLGDYVGLLGGLTGLIGLVVSVLSLEESRGARKAAEIANDRASGRIVAKFEVEELTWKVGQILPGMVREIDGHQELKVQNLDELRMIDFKLRVRNTGTEPIEAMQLDSRIDFLGVHFPDWPKDRDWGARRSWFLDSVITTHVQLPRKFLPGEAANVPLTKPILQHILSTKSREVDNNDHYGRFDISAIVESWEHLSSISPIAIYRNRCDSYGCQGNSTKPHRRNFSIQNSPSCSRNNSIAGEFLAEWLGDLAGVDGDEPHRDRVEVKAGQFPLTVVRGIHHNLRDGCPRLRF